MSTYVVSDQFRTTGLYLISLYNGGNQIKDFITQNKMWQLIFRMESFSDVLTSKPVSYSTAIENLNFKNKLKELILLCSNFLHLN